MALRKRLDASRKRIRPQQGGSSKSSRLYDLGSMTMLVEQDAKRRFFIFDECLGVPSTPRADRYDICSGFKDVVISTSDLTGPFSAR